jgi:chromosome segregation ATPase
MERIKADQWYARQALLQAQLAEAEELERTLPTHTERLYQELEDAKRALHEARTHHDAIEAEFKLKGEQVRTAKADILRITKELQDHAGQRPIEREG